GTMIGCFSTATFRAVDVRRLTDCGGVGRFGLARAATPGLAGVALCATRRRVAFPGRASATVFGARSFLVAFLARRLRAQASLVSTSANSSFACLNASLACLACFLARRAACFASLRRRLARRDCSLARFN